MFNLKKLLDGAVADINLWDGGKSHGNMSGAPRPASTAKPSGDKRNIVQRGFDAVNPFDNGKSWDNAQPTTKKALWQQALDNPVINPAGAILNTKIPGLGVSASQVTQQVPQAVMSLPKELPRIAKNVSDAQNSLAPMGIRDILDANTAEDIRKRTEAGEAAMYADQQKALGNKRPSQNVGAALFGGGARFANTAKAGYDEFNDTLQLLAIDASGNKAARDAKLQQIRERQQSQYQPNSGIFGSGTWFNSPDDFQKTSGDPLALISKAAASVGETALERASFGLGQVENQLAKQGLNQFLKTGLQKGGVRFVEGAISDALGQTFTRDEFSPEQSATSGAAAVALPIAVTGAGKVLRKGFNLAGDAVSKVTTSLVPDKPIVGPTLTPRFANDVPVNRAPVTTKLAPTVEAVTPAPRPVTTSLVPQPVYNNAPISRGGAPIQRSAKELADELAASQARAIDPAVQARRASFTSKPTQPRVNIDPDDQAIIRDLNDYVAGTYQPGTVGARRLETDAAMIAEKYNLPVTRTTEELAEALDGLNASAKNSIFYKKPGKSVNQNAPKPSKQDPLEALKAEARKYKSADEFVKNTDHTPQTTRVYIKSKFRDGGGYADVPVIREEKNITLYQGGTGENRQFWTPNKEYAKKFGNGEVVKKTGNFYQIDNGNRMTDVYVDADKQLTDLYNQATKPKAYYQNVPKSYTEPKKTAFEENTGVVAPTRKSQERLSMLEQEFNASREALESNPAAQLMKYANKRTMELPEVTATGKPTKFGKDGDQIVTELGYRDSEQARAEFEKFAMQRELHKNLADRFKEAKTATRLAERENKADLTNLLNTPEARGMAPTTAPDAPTSQSAFGKSLKDKGYDIEIPGYQRLANEDVFAQAEKSIATDERGVINSLLSRNQRVAPTPLENAQSISLLTKLAREGRDEEAMALAKATASSSREAGRAVQILSKLEAITPEGATVRAQRIIQEYNDKMSRKAKELTLTEDNYKAIKGLAEEAQNAEIGTRERDLAEGKLLKYIEDLVPASALKKLSSAQTMAQLLNPKTAIRNILGNAVGTIAEDISTAPAVVVDAIVSKMKGNGRSVAVANPFVKASGMKTGLKYGIEDVQLGIKTSGITGKFDVQPDVFKKGIMKKLQTALGYELGAPDKAFYQGQFDSTMDSLMRARKVTKPTLDMVEIANGEALYATFQNNSKLAQSLSKVKGVLNVGKEWGMGDIVLKYPKTPGNIVSVGLDYSPYGVFKGAAQLYKNWEKLPLDAQREAVRNIGRGITGTGAIALGYTLASNGIITGKPNADKDMSKLEREAGQGPFSFNMNALGRFLRGGDTKPQAGDTVMNYDWIQPAAIALSMGANMKINDKSAQDGINAAWESLASGVDTITDQPVLKGVGDFARTSFQPREQGGGVDKAIANAVAGAPASFVPSSVNQVGQLTDPTARETRGPNFGLQVLDTVNARIPGLRTSLPASKTSLGEDRTMYEEGKNNLFNVFLNPAFVKTYKDDEVVNLVRDINDRSGETQQVPRTAARSIKINGEQVKLQPTEYSKYQEYIGKKTNDQFGKLSQDPKFMALSDEEKAKKMSNVMSDINAAAKIELFGNKPKTVDKNVKKVLSGEDITSLSSSSKATNPKERYKEALDKYNEDKKEGKISEVNEPTRQKELAKLKIKSDFDEDTVDLYSKSYKDIIAFVNSNKNGKKYWEQVKALDKATVDAGGTSKLYNKNGSLKSTVAKGTKAKKAKKGKYDYSKRLAGSQSDFAAIRNLVKRPKYTRKKVSIS